MPGQLGRHPLGSRTSRAGGANQPMEPDREDRSAAHAGLRDAWRRRSLASGWLAADDWPSEAVDAVLSAACGTGSLAVKETGLLAVKDTGLALVEDGRMRSEERRVGKECRSWWSPYY